MTNPRQTLVTSAEVAARLGISTRTVYRLVTSGRLIAAVKAPGLRGAFLFEPRDVDRFVRERDRIREPNGSAA